MNEKINGKILIAINECEKEIDRVKDKDHDLVNNLSSMKGAYYHCLEIVSEHSKKNEQRFSASDIENFAKEVNLMLRSVEEMINDKTIEMIKGKNEKPG